MYSGARFYPKESLPNVDMWGNVTTKTKFVMTKGYRAYLDEQEELRQKAITRNLKHKLDYEFEKYGEVCPLDLQEFIRQVKAKPYKHTISRTVVLNRV
jgi:hypothetical protein